LREHRDPVLEIALGLAIPGSRPRLYCQDGTNNFTNELLSIAEAHASGRAFAIALRDAVIGIDVDPDVALGIRGAVAAALAACVDEEIPFIHNTSGRRPGHEHAFIVLPSRTRPDVFRRRLSEEFGIKAGQIRAAGHGTYMRPPLTPHRSGATTELMYPATAELAAEVARINTTFAPRTQAILDVEQYAVAAPNRSNLIARLITGAMNSNVPLEIVRSTLQNDEGPLGTKVRTRDYDDVERQWRNFQDFVTKHPGKQPGHVKREVERVREAAREFAGWCPQTLHNDRAALETLLLKAQACGSMSFTAATRSLALSAGMRKATLTKSIDRLEAFGFVDVISKAELLSEHGSLRYEIHSPLFHLVPGMDLPLDREKRRYYWYQVDAGHDAFAPKALAKQGWLILSSMPPDGADVAGVASACGYKSTRTTLAHLRNLAGLGVVECDADGLWHRAEPLDLDHAAALAGSAGYIDSIAARHEAERAADLPPWRQSA
jgi:hypothetical protein